MLFPKRFWAGIKDGSVTVAVRRWRRPSVKAGSTLHSPVGLLGIDSVEVIDASDITEADAGAAGYRSLDELLDQLARFPKGDVHRVRFHRVGDDPRIALRSNAVLSPDDVATITRRLDRLDRASSHGPWTRQALHLIEQHPGRRAPDLAAMVGRDTQPFKTDVRKLKAMGLTESLRIGYRLSPRGIAYRDATGLR